MELPLGIVNLPMVEIITKKVDIFVCLFQVCCKAVVLKLFTMGINSFKRNVTQKTTTQKTERNNRT